MLQQQDSPRHNLPPRDYERFVGRQKEFQELRRLLGSRSRAFVVTIDGIGGIGKSALALETAYWFLDQYAELPGKDRFEAIVWVSAKRMYLTAGGLRKRRQVFRTLEDLFATIARVLDYPAITRARIEEQREIVEQVLRQQRTLLILDNLETVDDEDLVDFLHELPEPTKAIATTRHRIDVARPVRLRGMAHQDALALIAQESTRKHVDLSLEQQEELWNRTGGVPLAIVWSIGLMGLGGSVESVIRRLGNGQSDIARFCFEESVAQIRGKDAHRLLLALLLFASDASREAIGVAAGLGDDPYGRDHGLEELIRLSLVNHADGRFGLLPLTKSFVQEEAKPARAWMLQAKRRWRQHFLDFTQEHGQWSQEWRALDHIEQELPNIMVLIDQLQAEIQYHEQPDGHHTIDIKSKPTAKALIRLIRILDRICRIRGYWSECERICKLSINVSRAINETGDIGWRCYTLSRLSYYRGDLESARHWAAEALDSWQHGQHTAMVCLARRLFGQFALDDGKLDEAESILLQAINDYQRGGNTGDLPHFISSLGDLARQKGDLPQAAVYYREAIDLWQQKNDLPYVAFGQINLGTIELEMGDSTEAQRCFSRGLEAATECVRRDMIAKAQYHLAALKYTQGEPAGAIELRDALDLFRRLGMKREQAEAEELLASLGEGEQES